ncbi:MULTISPECIES: hypothetical protein [Paenibacillus]|uniref:hypothetical protein n=1 Tax=Paenibacillus TaxID=44249 RepID=UPI0022B85A78|nr:hypothetical protein [Paenibacillus caseinilyticus]MCZ8519298.1 hypothetical protein [Paenibacillus caseinilyticus]
METSIPLDILHTLRQLGINTARALEAITLDPNVFSAVSSDLNSGTTLAGETE